MDYNYSTNVSMNDSHIQRVNYQKMKEDQVRRWKEDKRRMELEQERF